MRHGSLFSGIGGFDLAAEWMGWENVFHCEWNEFGQRILKYYWPNAISYDDITKTDFTRHKGEIDIISGGFPCQPYSQAGKRLGKEDDRHLWPEMLRAIREIQPSYVVGENVRGLTNWNGGLVFDEVQADLEAEGYEVTPFLLPACAVNAPHRRDRIWFVAYSLCQRHTIPAGSENNNKEWQVCEEEQKIGVRVWPEINGRGRLAPYTELGNISRTRGDKPVEERIFTGPCGGNDWSKFPTQSPICGGDDGISSRLDGITISKWRGESIKAYGNTIVPQVAYQIFKALVA